MYDVIIIGSGPAGQSAAIYSMRAGLSMLLIDKNPMGGGQVLNTYEVDNYPGLPGINGFELGMKFHEHAQTLGVTFMEEEVLKIDVMEKIKKVHTATAVYEAQTLIFAAGASHAKLSVKGEEELAGMGVSYCATCDGAFYKKKVTAVVGGGDVAVEDAIFLARFCEKVYLVHRRDELRAAKTLQEALFALPNVEVVWNSIVEEILGEERVEGICIQDVISKEKNNLEIAGVFVAVGIQPNIDILPNEIEKNENGYILAGEDCATNIAGVFAAGDIRKKPLRQIVTAVADGANAVNSIQEYLIKVAKQ